ncbi:MAG TPA: pre-16S rRNA-processing nuclease YqgF, partial [Candidatus Hydrogenedentes bacterium]|nr:pre-16S rRNA-processing nuclease YqgF [Candidatus Hydrogenedentota bacterium]
MLEQGVIIGLDVGEARTGIARSDALQLMAFPLTVVAAGTDREMSAAVAAAIRPLNPVLVVAGMPLNQHGEPGLQAQRVKTVLD